MDAVVCDPPYEIGFMAKGWDKAGVAFAPATWREILRVLKPGGHLLTFGGTRTYHRLACAVEDAGFEIRDSIHWIYGSGFPKSLNIGNGWGTALKPAHEPVVLARKSLEGTVVANVQKWGTGALNIDGCRIPTTDKLVAGGPLGVNAGDTRTGKALGMFQEGTANTFEQHTRGRWPANVMFMHKAVCLPEACVPGCPVMELDRQSGVSRSTGGRIGKKAQGAVPVGGAGTYEAGDPGFGDTGGASRFFYCAKPSRRERDHGLDAFPARSGGEATDREDGTAGLNSPRAGAGRTGGSKNFHPTVKPVSLMRELVRLVTPPGGIVLDPFVGSGSTGMAARLEGFRFVGIDLSAEYLALAHARISAAHTLK